MSLTDIEDKTRFDLSSQLSFQKGLDVINGSVNDENTCVAMDVDGFFQLFVLWVCWFDDLPDSDRFAVDLDAWVLASLVPC